MESLTANTVRRGEGEGSPPARLDDMTWIVGRWRCEALGGTCEEVWSPPDGGAMMGMFRLVSEGKVIFYELMTLTQEDTTLSLQLKHFNADLTGWEEKDGKVVFPLVAWEQSAAHFEGLSFRRVSDDEITVHVALRGKGGAPEEAAFLYRRA